ncbi:MAG TPA: hypothetical protein VJX67_12835 [Blastocatellia bacterium]|nr:hypothetical protein [Blastocatellia bacterium]
MSIGKVLDAVRAMTPAERAKVRALLETLGSGSNSSQEAARLRLFESGLLTTLRAPEACVRSRRSLARIDGQPLSETVVEERG